MLDSALVAVIADDEAAPTTLVFGTLGIALIVVLAEPLWRPLRDLVGRVIDAQEITMKWAKKLLGNSLFTLAVLASPSWVALGMVHNLVNGEDPMRTLVKALAANAAVAIGVGFTIERLGALAIAAAPGFVLYIAIVQGRPLAQAGVIALAAWFLLLGGLRFSIELVVRLWPIEKWRKVPTLKEIGIPPRIWTPLLTLFALGCLVLGARWLLGWQYPSDYDQIIVSMRPCGSANPC